MYSLAITILSAWVAPPAALRVELESTSQQRVIFLEHTGPYWKAGTKFAEVREYMQLHDERGPMFMRYFRPGSNRLLGKRTSLIGFFAKDATMAQSPFQARTIAPRDVVRLVLEGHVSSSRQLLKKMDRWVTDNDQAASGEVMEIYHVAVGDRGRIERTEFQLPLVTTPTDPSPPIRVRPRATEYRPNRIRTEPTNPAEEMLRTAPAIKVETDRQQTPDSISALVRAGRYDRVAELVLPDDDTVDPNDQVWIGKVFFRIKAAGKGLAQTNFRTSSNTRLLADSLLKRYRKVFKDTASNPLLGATPSSTEADGPRTLGKRRLMRRLDSLLSRITYGHADAEAVETEVVDVLRLSRKLLAE